MWFLKKKFKSVDEVLEFVSKYTAQDKYEKAHKILSDAIHIFQCDEIYESKILKIHGGSEGDILQNISDIDIARLYNERGAIARNLYIKYHNQGESFYSNNAYLGSIKDYRMATDFDPMNWRAWFNWANLYARDSNSSLDLALEYYHKALKINPNYSDIYNNMGLLYDEFGDVIRAQECYEKASKAHEL